MGEAYRPGNPAGAPHGAVAQLVGAERCSIAQVAGSNPACSTSPIQAVYLWASKKAEPIPSSALKADMCLRFPFCRRRERTAIAVQQSDTVGYPR